MSFPFDPVHCIHKTSIKFTKRLLNSCHNVHSVRTQFDPVPQHFGERTANEFGVNEALAPGLWLNIKTVFPSMGIAMLKIRQLQDHLIFNLGIPILLRQHLYFELAPRILSLRLPYLVVTFRIISFAIDAGVHSLTLEGLGHFFQNLILFSNLVPHKYNIFIWNWSNTMNV